MEKPINIPNSQFAIGNVILIESNFSRPYVFDATDPSKITHDTLIELENTDLNQDVFAVFMSYTFNVLYDSQKIIKAFVKYSAEFKADSGLTYGQKEDFANINAPAMLYPFIREGIASSTARAMVGAVLIPPVNFIQIYKDKKARATASE